MPPVVTTVRESGDRSGSFLTVCRDPQAKNPDPIKPTTNPVPTDRLWTITPLASTPPKSTRITAKRNRIVNCLLSKITSKPMAVIGIAATARAAVVASDIDCATSNMTEPNPNPKKPIRNPASQGRSKRPVLRSKSGKKANNTTNPNVFRTKISARTPELSKRIWAAGKPAAKKIMAKAQNIFPLMRDVLMCSASNSTPCFGSSKAKGQLIAIFSIVAP